MTAYTNIELQNKQVKLTYKNEDLRQTQNKLKRQVETLTNQLHSEVNRRKTAEKEASTRKLENQKLRNQLLKEKNDRANVEDQLQCLLENDATLQQLIRRHQ